MSGLALTGTSVSYTINNIGSATAASSTTGIYLSTDATITTNDTLLTTVATPSLTAGQSDSEGTTLSFPTNLTPGIYYIGALADSGGQIAEGSESNNASNVMAVLLGNSSANSLAGTSGADTIFGLGGDDTLDGGAGADTMVGGIGNDIVWIDNLADQVIENAGEGQDWAYFQISGGTLPQNVEFGLVAMGAGQTCTLYGTAANDTLFGNAENDTFYGGAGNDDLYGRAGTDILDGGAGTDFLTGGADNDVFVLHAGEANGDTIWDFAGNGANAGDQLQFVGYGTAAQGAALVQIDSTHWRIDSANGTVHDVITMGNGASIHPTDYVFV